MILRVKLKGDGSDLNPRTVNLPTYHMLLGNVDEGWAFVVVPEEVHGLTEDDLKHETRHLTTRGYYFPSLCDDCIGKVHKHWETYYVDGGRNHKLELAK